MNLSRQFCAAFLSMAALVGPAVAGTSALTKVGDLSEATLRAVQVSWCAAWNGETKTSISQRHPRKQTSRMIPTCPQADVSP